MPKPINKKVKSHIKFRTGARLRRKNEATKDTLQRIEGRPPADNGLNMRIKIRRKSK